MKEFEKHIDNMQLLIEQSKAMITKSQNLIEKCQLLNKKKKLLLAEFQKNLRNRGSTSEQ